MDITLESSVESLVAVGLSLDESEVSRQLVGVTLESSDFDDCASENVSTSPSSRQSEDSLPVPKTSLFRFPTSVFLFHLLHPSSKVHRYKRDLNSLL